MIGFYSVNFTDWNSRFILDETLPIDGNGRWGSWATFAKMATYQDADSPKEAC